MRIVLDTVVFVRSLIKPSNACGRIIFLHGNQYSLVLSKPIVTEILEVLHRPEITSKFSASVPIDYKQLLDYLSHAEAVELDDIPNLSRDIKDNIFLATAHAAKADYLITQDQDLLVLKEIGNTKIIQCPTFANILEGK